MIYDNWKTATPDSYDYEEGKECNFCGCPVKDDREYCSKECKTADSTEGV